MPQLSYWEQQWVRMTRLLLGVKAPNRRGNMRRRRRMMTRELNTLRHALSTYGLPCGDRLPSLPAKVTGDGADALALGTQGLREALWQPFGVTVVAISVDGHGIKMAPIDGLIFFGCWSNKLRAHDQC